jgi:hypothetical protein
MRREQQMYAQQLSISGSSSSRQFFSQQQQAHKSENHVEKKQARNMMQGLVAAKTFGFFS